MKVPSQMSFDVEAIRAQFPILRTLVHGRVPLHYLDNAATAQVPEAVLEQKFALTFGPGGERGGDE